jgi:hypothetical protein
MPVQLPYEYSQMLDISLNDVSFTSMTVHMETVYAPKECNGFRCFLEPTTVPWIVLILGHTITGLDEATTYTFMAGQHGWNQRELV